MGMSTFRVRRVVTQLTHSVRDLAIRKMMSCGYRRPLCKVGSAWPGTAGQFRPELSQA